MSGHGSSRIRLKYARHQPVHAGRRRRRRSDTFRPEDYEDEVRQRILAQIEKKVDGQEITLEPDEQPRAQVIDLMQALKSSLARKAGSRRPAKRSPRKTAGAAGKRAKTSGR